MIAETLQTSGISGEFDAADDRFLRKETDRWGKVFKDCGIQLN